MSGAVLAFLAPTHIPAAAHTYFRLIARVLYAIDDGTGPSYRLATAFLRPKCNHYHVSNVPAAQIESFALAAVGS